MSANKLRFANANGEMLAALLELPANSPEQAPRACALFAHCFTCSKNLKAVTRICRALTAQGIAVLRFDFTGLGDSEGDFSDSNFSSNISDLISAADFMRDTLQAPAILIGHSLGGAAVLKAAAQIPECRAVCTIAAPFDARHIHAMFSEQRDIIEANGEAEVQLGGRSFRIKKQFLDDLQTHSTEQHIRDLKRALLIFHSPLDETVSIEHAAHIFTAAKHPKSFISLDRADHLLSNDADAAYVGTVLAAWADKYA